VSVVFFDYRKTCCQSQARAGIFGCKVGFKYFIQIFHGYAATLVFYCDLDIVTISERSGLVSMNYYVFRLYCDNTSFRHCMFSIYEQVAEDLVYLYFIDFGKP